ncbi:coadhesin-like isoform X2 [Mercenaria mercenaria]|uniref:coadhesin-like isoform X2 n=1 Tax=Mercenaria mercenaria TaxID=6596 RepID=UPI00234ECF6B|nr:coadhesin-like isoform X2 [Mercenaria mercenaria]
MCIWYMFRTQTAFYLYMRQRMGGKTMQLTGKCYLWRWAGVDCATKFRIAFEIMQKPVVVQQINGGWTSWTTWSACTRMCGTGRSSRTRAYTNPVPQNNGAQCSGSATDMQSCNTNPCPIDGGWTSWTKWTTCTRTCDTGKSSRTRTCTNPAPQHNGAQCSGSAHDTKTCSYVSCPVDGGWTSWTRWTTCSRTCDMGFVSRGRSCTNLAPQHNETYCSGSGYDTRVCSHDSCRPASTICVAGDIIDHLLFKTFASHPSARYCTQSNTNSDSEALLLAHCKPPNMHWQRWTADLKVIDHCTTLAQGDPIGVYINGRIGTGVFAVFWRCKTSSASFEIAYQSCGEPVRIIDVRNSQFTPETLYTLKW